MQTNLYTGERICVALFYNREGISGGRGGEGERKDGEEGKEEDTGGYRRIHIRGPDFFPLKRTRTTLLNGIAVIHRSGGNSVVVMPSAQITRRILRHK